MNNARLTCTRELKSKGSATPATVEIGSWPIEDICWYLGCESKRRAPYNLNVTFIERGKPVERSKEHPHFGRTISFESREFFIKWIASMLVAEHAYNVKSTQALLVIDWKKMSFILFSSFCWPTSSSVWTISFLETCLKSLLSWFFNGNW